MKKHSSIATYKLPRLKAWFMLVVLGITAYAPTLPLDFMWDDHIMIEINPSLHHWSVDNIVSDFTTDVFLKHGNSYYRPLQTLANRVDYTIGKLNPLGYHITNLLFHLGNAILVWELALLLGMVPVAAFIVGSLFAVHPIAVEQLMIVAGRAELMSLFFILLSLLLWFRKERPWIALGWLSYIAALFCKEHALLTPFFYALLLFWTKAPRRAYMRILWMLLLWLPYLVLRHAAVGPALPTQDLVLTIRFFFQEFPNVIFRYLGLLVVPWNLHSHRLLPHLNYFWPLTLLALGGLGIVAFRRSKRISIFCMGWFLLALLPRTPVMIYGNFMLDHWAYPALIAILIPLGFAVAHVGDHADRRIRNLAGGLYGLALVGFALLVHLNVALRGTDEKMYRWALHFTTSLPIHYNLGTVLLETGRAREALQHFAMVHAYDPDNVKNTHALAVAYAQSGYLKAAHSILVPLHQAHPEFEPAAVSLKTVRQKLAAQKK